MPFKTLRPTAIALVLLAGFSAPALAQRCVAQGDGRNWTDGCNSGRTVVIEIEAPQRIIMGPPQIIWVPPSAGNSTQSTFSNVVNPSVRQALGNLSETGWTLRNKGRRAEQAGDHAAALAYYEAALRRDNSPDEAREIDADYARLRQMFDSGSGNVRVDKFQKTASAQVVLNVDVSNKHAKLIRDLFDPTRSDLSPHRESIMPLFLKRSEEKSKVEKLQSELSTLALAAGSNTNSALDQKKGELRKAQEDVAAANDAVEKKMDEIQLIVIRK